MPDPVSGRGASFLKLSKQTRQQGIFLRKPAWLGRPLPSDPAFSRVRFLLEEGGLHTVCQEARCPNQGECFSRGTAVFLILGDSCTRRCRFCAVTQGTPERPDPGEPERVPTWFVARGSTGPAPGAPA